MATKTKSKSAGDAGDEYSAGEFRSSAQRGTAIIGGNTFAAKAVQYAVVDGQAIFEGDIVLGTVEEVERQSQLFKQAASDPEIANAVVITGNQFRWPNCQIPFEVDPNLPNAQRVTDAIAHWTANTHYTFIARTPQNAAQHPDFVRFVPGDGCSSQVGRRGGRQDVTLAPGCTAGSTIHEIGHVVGLWHEQSREDRDHFVTIHWANITAGFEHNFDQHIADGDDVGAYDYGSIMHYPRTAFSSNGQDTITPTQAGAQIGQRNGLSPSDIAAANSICTPPATLKFSDDPQTLKFSDDPQTVKFIDDPQTLKFSDDPQTLKFKDDPTLKFSDDPTLKFSDDPTLKFSDDPTLKFSDDPTLKFSDDPTLKFKDDPTLKFSDDPTLKFSDDPSLKISDDPTLKFSDDPSLKISDDPTLKFSDDPSLKISDDPTLKFSDDPAPTLKFKDDPLPTLKFKDDVLPKPGGGLGDPTNAPFVLSTPHHSNAWAQSFPEAYQAQIAQLESELEQRHQMLQQADQAYQQGGLSPQDLQQLEAAYQEYLGLLQEYQANTQGR